MSLEGKIDPKIIKEKTDETLNRLIQNDIEFNLLGDIGECNKLTFQVVDNSGKRIENPDAEIPFDLKAYKKIAKDHGWKVADNTLPMTINTVKRLQKGIDQHKIGKKKGIFSRGGRSGRSNF